MLGAAAVEPTPLSTNADGVIRVGGTRVTLDTVIDTFMTGSSPEEIAQDFPVLRLDDIYAVVIHYLRHRAEFDAYPREGRARAEAIRHEIEAQSSQTVLLDRLLTASGGSPLLRLLADENSTAASISVSIRRRRIKGLSEVRQAHRPRRPPPAGGFQIDSWPFCVRLPPECA